MTTYTLESSDGQLFEVVKDDIKYCSLLMDVINLCHVNGPIPLFDIDGTTLKHVITLFKMWSSDTEDYDKPLYGCYGAPVLALPEMKYMAELSIEDLLKLCRASIYLAADRLVDATCVYVHSWIAEMETIEVCEFFGLLYEESMDISKKEEDILFKRFRRDGDDGNAITMQPRRLGLGNPRR